LSEILKEDIKIEALLESESNRESPMDKSNRVDLLVRNSSNTHVVIEIQVESEQDFLTRILYGTCKVITEYLKIGEAYSKVKKVYSVSILHFDLGRGKDYAYHGTTNFTGMHYHDTLKLTEKQKELYQQETIADVYPEYYLFKVNQFNDIAKTH